MARTTHSKNSKVDRPNRAKAVRNLSREGKRKKENRKMYIAIAVVVSIILTIVWIYNFRQWGVWNENKKQEAELKDQYKKELQISKELKEKKKFVQTDEYVEDMARKLGLLYPDEVILQPEND